MDKLNTLIDSLVAEKSLSFEVVEQLKAVRDENIKLGEELKVSKERIRVLEEHNNVLVTKNIELKANEDSVKAREIAVSKIEHEKEIANLKVDFANNRANEVKEIVSLVFKNPIIRKTAYNSIPVAVDGGNGCGGFVQTSQESISETVEEE